MRPNRLAGAVDRSGLGTPVTVKYRIMTIAFRIAISALSAVLIVLVPMSYFSYRATLGVIERQLRVIQPLFAEFVNANIAKQNANIETITRLAARETTADLDRTPEQFRKMFQEILNEEPAVFGFSLAFDPQGPMRHHGGWNLHRREIPGETRWTDLAEPVDGYDFTKRIWYSAAVNRREPVWSKPYLGRFSNVPMVSYSIPITNSDGKLIGVLACDISIQWIDDFVDELSIPRKDIEQLFLLSQDGIVLADRHWDMLYKNIFDLAREHNDRALEKVARSMTAGEWGNLEYKSLDGIRDGRIIFVPINDASGNEGSHWSLAVFVSQEAVHGFAVNVGGRQVAIGLIGLMAMIVLLMFVAHGISRPIRELQESALTIASGDLEAKIPELHGRDEISALAGSFTKMQHDLKDYIGTLAETTRRKEQMESDLRIGRKIQMSLVPTRFPETPFADHFDLAAFMEPAKEVGGDFYDYFLLDDESLCVVIADVSGKGVPASLLMARGSAFFRSYLFGTGRLADAANLVNRELCKDNDACMFITLFAAILHLPSGRCRHVNAGHNPPFFLRKDAEPVMLPSGTGLPLGIDEDSHYTETEDILHPDDLLFLYTDGVTEAMNPDSELFGEFRTAATLKKNRNEDCHRVIVKTLDDIHAFVQETPQSDDITMVSLRYR